MTNQCLARGSPKPVVHKAHANAFIFFPVARNFLPLPILAALLSFLFFFFSFPSPFFYFKFHRSSFNGFLPLPPSLWAENTAHWALVPLEREFQRWWSMHRLIRSRRPAPDRGEFLVGASLMFLRCLFFPSPLCCSLMRWYVRKMRNI